MMEEHALLKLRKDAALWTLSSVFGYTEVAQLDADVQFCDVGAEGVVFTHVAQPTSAFKVMDRYSIRAPCEHDAFLTSLAGTPSSNLASLRSVRRVCGEGRLLVLETERIDAVCDLTAVALTGNCNVYAPAFISLLKECCKMGLVLRNLQPHNLLVTSDEKRVVFVDWGLDVKPFDQDEYRHMAKQLYILAHFAHREDCKGLLKLSANRYGAPTSPLADLPCFAMFSQQDIREEMCVPELFGLHHFMLGVLDGAAHERQCLEHHGYSFLELDSTWNGLPGEQDTAMSSGQLSKMPLCVHVHHPFYRSGGSQALSFHALQRLLLQKFGCQVTACSEVIGFSTEPTCIAGHLSHFLGLELEPLNVPPSCIGDEKVSLLIKACYMEHATIRQRVHHLVSQLEGPRVFHQRVMVVDNRVDEFVRQYADADLSHFEREAAALLSDGLLDRVVYACVEPEEVEATNEKWLGHIVTWTHTEGGYHVTSAFQGLDACAEGGAKYVLQIDSDMLIARISHEDDFLEVGLAVLRAEPSALSVALPTCSTTRTSPEQAYRWEVRASLLDLSRLHALLPLSIDGRSSDGKALLNSKGQLCVGWHRVLDLTAHHADMKFYRWGDPDTYSIHPDNQLKVSKH
jgi:hypothetical protein